jgi:hypothetical protein
MCALQFKSAEDVTISGGFLRLPAANRQRVDFLALPVAFAHPPASLLGSSHHFCSSHHPRQASPRIMDKADGQ